MEGLVSQTEAGLTLLDKLLAFQTASGEALNGARHWADTQYESVAFAVVDVATLLGRLRGGRMPSPRAVPGSLRRSNSRTSAALTRHKAVCYAAQGTLLRGTRQVVTRHKAVCYAA